MHRKYINVAVQNKKDKNVETKIETWTKRKNA